MSKAILVMDMPESCEQCRLHVFGRNCNVICKATGITQSYDVAYEEKHPGCPLREVPQKQEVCGKYPQADGITPSYKIGWNNCINEILKGEQNG